MEEIKEKEEQLRTAIEASDDGEFTYHYNQGYLEALAFVRKIYTEKLGEAFKKGYEAGYWHVVSDIRDLTLLVHEDAAWYCKDETDKFIKQL